MDLGEDSWSTLKAPFQWTRQDLPRLGAVTGVGLLLFAFDEQLYDAVQDARDRPIPGAIEDVGTFLEPLGNVGGPTVAFMGGWAIAEFTGHHRTAVVFQELVNSQLISTVTRHIVRGFVGRARPRDGEGAYVFRPFEYTSFPSGHASTITQVAAILSHNIGNPWASGVLWAGAGTVMYQRVTSAAHWPSDVWFGAWWGYGIARVVMAAREADWVDVQPYVDSASGGAGVQVRVPF